VREIGLGHASLTGHYVTRKGIDLPWESVLERDCFMLCDYEPSVTGLMAQPLRVGRHVPDLKLETKNGSYLVDVKPETKLLEIWLSDRTRFAETQGYSEREKISYNFFTDAARYELSTRLAVLKYIHQYGKDEPRINVDPTTVSESLESGQISVRDLCASFGEMIEHDEKRRLVARLVYSGQLAITETPTAFFDDSKVGKAPGVQPLAFLVPYERMIRRLEVHPLRFLSKSKPSYFEGMRSIELEGHHYEVLDSSDPASVLVRSSESQEEYRIALDTLPAPGGRLTMLAVQAADSDKYYELLRKADIISPLASRLKRGERLSHEDKARAASVLEMSERQVERYAVRMRDNGIDGLIRPQRKDKGLSRLPEEVQSKIKASIERRKKPGSALTLSGARVISDLEREILEHNRGKPLVEHLRMPAKRTIYYQVAAISPRERTAKLEGVQAANNSFGLYGGEFPDGGFPLQTAQIDHTPLDILLKLGGKLIDPESNRACVRPYLTLMEDTYSRVILAYVLNFKQPNANQTGLVILKCAKKWGIPAQLHFDNGKDFRSNLIVAGCVDIRNRILLMYRPVRTPRFGGTIESLMKSFQERYIHDLPGNTKSNPKKRADLDSVKSAVLNDLQLEELLDLAVEDYNNTPHSGLEGLTPLQKWEQGVKQFGRPRQLTPDEEPHFRVSFLPIEQRTVNKDGIHLFGLKYYRSQLQKFLERGKGIENRTVNVRYDPTDITKVYVLDSETSEYIIALSKLRGGPYDLRGWLRARAHLREKGFRDPAEDVTLETYKKMQAILEKAAQTSKLAAKALHNSRRERRNTVHAVGEDLDEETQVEQNDAKFVPQPGDLDDLVIQRGGRAGARQNGNENAQGASS
jgi:putative transposase